MRSASSSHDVSGPPAASASIDSVVAQVARLLSIGQLPSSRTDAARNDTPFRITACALASPRSGGGRSLNAASRTGVRSSAARLITTKLVSGVASRKPPVAGWIARSVASVRRRVAVRASQAAGLRVGRIWCRTWPMAMSAGSA